MPKFKPLLNQPLFGGWVVEGGKQTFVVRPVFWSCILIPQFQNDQFLKWEFLSTIFTNGIHVYKKRNLKFAKFDVILKVKNLTSHGCWHLGNICNNELLKVKPTSSKVHTQIWV